MDRRSFLTGLGAVAVAAALPAAACQFVESEAFVDGLVSGVGKFDIQLEWSELIIEMSPLPRKTEWLSRLRALNAALTEPAAPAPS